VLGGVKVGTGLAISSGVLSVSYGAAAGTACVGNDSRLSDSRAPTAHALDGALHTISGKTAGQVLVATGATTFGFVTVSGDATLSGTGALTLPTLLTAGSAGSATSVPTLTWDAKGRLTAVGSAAISIPHTQINDWSTATAGYLTTVLGDVASRGANIVYAGPNGSAGPATFRSLVYQDIPGYTRLFGNIDPNGFTIPQENANAIGWNRAAGNGEFDFITNRTNLAGGFNWYSVLNGVWSTAMTLSSGGTLYAVASVNAPTLYEGGIALSSKYLQSNQSISLTGAVTGWGTTSIATSFANTHLAGINQELATTSSPTFANATIHGAQYTVNSGASNFAAIYGSATDIRHLAYTWALDGSYNYINASNTVNLDINGVDLIALTSTAFAVTPASTFTGLITANGGISGNLTGHASLDIPLTGSSAITGALVSSSAATFADITANSDLHVNGMIYIGGSMMWGLSNTLFIGSASNNIHIDTVNNAFTTSMPTTIHATLTANLLYSTGDVVLDGKFRPAVNTQSASYTITSSDQGKIVVSNSQLNLPESGIPTGFWCIVNWHVGGGGVKFGPTTSGTNWYLRGASITTGTSSRFSGIVSWDGYTWVAG